MFHWRDPSTRQLLLLIMVVGAGAWMVSYMREAAQLGPEAAKGKLQSAQAAPLAGESELPRPRQHPFESFDSSRQTLPESVRESFNEACAVLSRAVSAESTVILADCVRHPHLTMPRVKSQPPDRKIEPAMPLTIGPQFCITGDLLLTTIRLQDGTDRAVVLQNTAEGCKLDWEGFTGWCEASFSEILAQPGPRSVLLRVQCRPSSAKAPSADEKGLSFTLSHPAEKQTLSAFVPEGLLRASETGKALQAARDKPFTLRVTTDAALAAKGWVRVSEIVCAGWVTDK
jgi:hypothetical protein